MMEMKKYRNDTIYPNVYQYIAPEGMEWWSDNTNFGRVIYGGAELINIYYLKEKTHEDNTEKNIH